MTVEQRTGSLSFWKRDLHISARLLLREAFSEAVRTSRMQHQPVEFLVSPAKDITTQSWSTHGADITSLRAVMTVLNNSCILATCLIGEVMECQRALSVLDVTRQRQSQASRGLSPSPLECACTIHSSVRICCDGTVNSKLYIIAMCGS